MRHPRGQARVTAGRQTASRPARARVRLQRYPAVRNCRRPRRPGKCGTSLAGEPDVAACELEIRKPTSSPSRLAITIGMSATARSNHWVGNSTDRAPPFEIRFSDCSARISGMSSTVATEMRYVVSLLGVFVCTIITLSQVRGRGRLLLWFQADFLNDCLPSSGLSLDKGRCFLWRIAHRRQGHRPEALDDSRARQHSRHIRSYLRDDG
jgi:hypothetical protein